MTPRIAAAVVSASLTVSACVPAVRSLPPAADIAVPADWRTDLGIGETVAPAWWGAFDDASLSALVGQARANNPDIAIAAERVREARAQIDAARAALRPSFDGQLGAADSRNLGPFGTAAESLAVQPQFQAAYEIDLFGRNRDQLEATRANALAAEMGQEAANLSVTAATVNGYVTLLALDSRRIVLQQTLDQRGEARRIAASRARVGYTSQLELRQAEAEYQATAAQLPPVDLAITRAENALSLLTGTAPRAIVRGSLARLRLPDPPAALPSQVVAGRPDIVQSTYGLVAADRALAVARKDFLPRIRLAASLGAILSPQLDSPVSIWSLGGSVLAPIFAGGRLRAGYEVADARRAQAAIGYRRTVLTAFREVEDQMAAVARFRAQRDDLVAQRNAISEAVRHATNRYQAGYSPYLEQLDAQRQLLQVELALVQNRADRLSAVTALYQAVGGAELADPPVPNATARESTGADAAALSEPLRR